MTITAALVLYAVIWFLTLFVVLPLRLTTQGEAGEVVPGTHAGAPANLRLRRKLGWTTAVATAIWVAVSAVILSGAISVRDFDVMDRLAPLPADGRGE